MQIYQKQFKERREMKFYNVKTRQPVEVPDDRIKVITMRNGKKAAQAEMAGVRMFKILSDSDAARLSR